MVHGFNEGHLQWLRQNINQRLYSQQTLHISPSRASYGVSIVSILEKTDHIMTAPRCRCHAGTKPLHGCIRSLLLLYTCMLPGLNVLTVWTFSQQVQYIIKGWQFRWLKAMQNNSSVLAMELLQSCTKPSICRLESNTKKHIRNAEMSSWDSLTLMKLELFKDETWPSRHNDSCLTDLSTVTDTKPSNWSNI